MGKPHASFSATPHCLTRRLTANGAKRTLVESSMSAKRRHKRTSVSRKTTSAHDSAGKQKRRPHLPSLRLYGGPVAQFWCDRSKCQALFFTVERLSARLAQIVVHDLAEP